MWATGGVRDEKSKGEGWAPKLHLTKQDETPSETAPMNRFLLPLIGQSRLNLVLTPKRCPGANKSCKALLMTLTCLDTSRMRKRKRKETTKWRWVRKSTALSYSVIIDFPSALQWRFSTNIFCHNARRKHLIRWWYESHENGKSFMRGWLQKLILTDRYMRWHKLGIDLTAIYEDAP